MATTPVCNVLGSLADFQYDILGRINKKFLALRRLAQLLEQLGDLATLIPNIDLLIPVVDIDLDLYEELVSNCPFLNLPQVSSPESLNQLRTLVRNAYSNLTKNLLNSPWKRMGLLQDQLFKYQQQLNSQAANYTQFLDCLAATCNFAEGVGNTVAKYTQADVAAEAKKYAEDYLANSGQVLTNTQQQKADQVTEAVDRLRDLGADVNVPYQQGRRNL